MIRSTDHPAKWIVLLTMMGFTVALSPSIPVFAAAADGSLSGLIRAASGNGIPDAQVSIRNTATGNVRSAVSTEEGSYAVHDLAPGDYEIEATAQGFISATVRVRVDVDSHAVADLTLSPASMVKADLKQATATSQSEAVDSKAMGELPLNGRSASDVAAMEPGVMKARTQSTHGENGFGMQMAIFGGRPRQNGSRLDGISVNDFANGPLGNAVGVSMGVDALEQMSVLVSNDQAQYGRSSGGYISSSTRSGTNRFHGTVFEYLRNSVFDAANYFDQEKPPFRRNQFGVSAGGPLWKDHTFIFADYEGLRQSQGATNVAAVPSEAARGGNLSTGTVVVDPEIRRVLDAFYPLPNEGLLGAGDTGIYISAGQKVTPGNHFTARIDHRISAKDMLSGVYMFDQGSSLGPDKLNNKLTGSDTQQHLLMLNQVHTVSPKSVNSVRLGINRVVANTGNSALGTNPYESDTSFGAVPGGTVPYLVVPGLVNLSGGLGGMDMYHFRWTSVQVYDDVSLIRGAHSLKFGVSLEWTRNNVNAIADPTGRFSFNSLADFLTNKPFSLSVTIPGATLWRPFRQIIVGSYFQDNWLFKPNLTVNLGLRYEAATVPNEANGRLSALQKLTDAQPRLGSPLFSNPTLRNVEPRVGFGWDPLGDGRTLVSSGFGIFDVLPLHYQIQSGELFAAPFYQAGNVTGLPPGSYPTEAFEIAASSPSTFRKAYFEPNPHRNYVMQWNLTIQRELPRGIHVKAGYVGSRGVHHIFRVKDANIVLPTRTAQGYVWPPLSDNQPRLNTNAGRITAASWQGDSSYDALVFQMKMRVGNRAQITGSYTWGKAIDNSSGSIEGDEYTNALTSPLWFDTGLNRGLSDFNVAHVLKVIYSWEINGPKWSSKLATWAVNGWQVGGVFETSTGLPFTPGVGGDPLGVKSTDPNLDLPNFAAGPGCDSPVNPGNPTHYIRTQCFAMPENLRLRGNLGRNTVIGPGLINLDFSVFKNNRIKVGSEEMNVQFRAEFFNIFNHPNFEAPIYNRNMFDSKGNPVGSAGLIDATATSSRQIQFALRIIW